MRYLVANSTKQLLELLLNSELLPPVKKSAKVKLWLPECHLINSREEYSYSEAITGFIVIPLHKAKFSLSCTDPGCLQG